jgi:hypothetical protein
MDNTGEKIYTFDQLILQRANDENQTPLFAYSKSRLGVTDYEFITGKKLNHLVDGAAKELIQSGIPPIVRNYEGILHMMLSKLTEVLRQRKP